MTGRYPRNMASHGPTRSLEAYLAELQRQYEAMPMTHRDRGRLALRICEVEAAIDPPRIVREVREITGRGEWLDWRRKDITASRIAALFNEHPFLTRDQLAADMRGEKGEPPNSAMRAGNILEAGFPFAVREDGKPWEIVKATTYHRLPDHRLGCTPDFWLDDDGLMQAKTVSPDKWDEWRGHPPLAYTLQTLTELLVTGRAWGVLAVMIRAGGYPVHYFDVPRHEGAERRILDAVAAWWAAWDAGEVAEPVPSAEIAAEVDDGSHRDLSSDNLLRAILPERAVLKMQMSAAEKRLKEIDYELKNRIGPARTAWVPGWSLSFAAQRRKETIIPAGEYRVLRVKETNDAE